ncbi:MAG: Rieske (2Fe-2S) protein, partial [Candidatus Eremiobacteraeota bacterium]|nr:Rieske (2Fe-2S) protein [Candidatus Eremiobacteraeota bacterium]
MLNPESSLNRRPTDRIAKLPWLAKISDFAQPIVRKLLESSGTPVRNALHGTWLGHPLHPLLTDVPVGAWTVTAAFDTLELFGYRELTGGADAALGLGFAGALAAAVTGYADWSDTAGEPKTLGTAHAMLNAGATVAYGASLVVRRVADRKLGIALGMAGYGLMSAAAYLGGELSMGMQIGAKHTAIPIFPATEFTPVFDEAKLESGRMVRADFGGIPLVLFRSVEGSITAIGAACTHRGAPLDEGTLEGDCVRCPWHGSLFAFEDGRVLEG